MEISRAIYKPSGRIGSGLFWIPAIGLAAIIPLSLAYGYGAFHNPLPKGAAILPIAGGFAMAGILYWAAYLGKCRNSIFTFIVSLIVNLIFTYAVWAAFLYILISNAENVQNLSFIDFFHPQNIWLFMNQIAEKGLYEVHLATNTESWLWVGWVFEALILVLFGSILPAVLINDCPFCEVSREWFSKAKGVLMLRPPNEADPVAKLIEGDLNTLLSLPEATAEDLYRYRVDLWTSESTDGMGMYRIMSITTVVGKKGNRQESESNLTKKFMLSAEEVARIRNYANGVTAPMAVAASAPVAPVVRDGFDSHATDREVERF